MKNFEQCDWFEDVGAWQVFASGQAEGSVTAVCDDAGRAGLRLAYNFHGGGGFVVIRREVKWVVPETFELRCLVRGEGPRNHVEFKVADPSGTNVWRHLRSEFALPGEWEEMKIRERDLPFAWGPAGGGAPSEVGAIEWVVAAGPGGMGVLELAAVELEDQTVRAPQAILASSGQPGFLAAAAFGGSGAAGWRAEDGDAQPWWSVDFGRLQRFGGVVIDWPEGLPARAYEVGISQNGGQWESVFRADRAMGGRSHIPVPGAEARHLRIQFSGAECAALKSVTLRPDAFSASPNEFVHQVAVDFPRGWFPRYWHREQSYWTPVGSPEGRRRGMINEEGMVEVDEAGFSLEPVLLTPGGMVTWAEVEVSQSMGDGGLPMPEVQWHGDGWSLEIFPWVDGAGDALTLRVGYRLRGEALDGVKLAVAVRPFQVNPPWQAFRNLGGRSPIHEISLQNGEAMVEGRRVLACPTAEEMGAAAFEEGGVHRFLATGRVPERTVVSDVSGLASAVMVWAVPEGETSLEFTVSVPFFAKEAEETPHGREAAVDRWREVLAGVEWSVPEVAREAIECFRTAAGQILINRDGAAIQPGPRRYTRSWVRDCVIMGAALAKAGVPHALREFIDWYAPFQREDGFVPCVVDRDGIDWLVEHDSHGQLLWGMREALRAGEPLESAQKWWNFIRRAAGYLVELRKSRMTDAFQSGERAACYGLLPESASHEGYLAHPVHSYWDDFWGIRGLEAAAEMAENLGETTLAADWRDEAARFQGDVLRSMERVISERGLHFLPGSVEWADFDPTATSNAIAQLDFADSLPSGPMEAMLETYLDGFRRKHTGRMIWNNYTAYEIRIIGAMVRLGKRREANELLEFFLSDRRPAAWNQWPEITWRNPRSPGHLGDVPHTWIAAEYLLAVAMMVASEREAEDSLVLASGMPWSWISSGDGFSVSGLPTRFGPLSMSLRGENGGIDVEISGLARIPACGLRISPPLPEGAKISEISVSAGKARVDGQGPGTIEVSELPLRAKIIWRAEI